MPSFFDNILRISLLRKLLGFEDKTMLSIHTKMFAFSGDTEKR
jgi:hypothetical protein